MEGSKQQRMMRWTDTAGTVQQTEGQRVLFKDEAFVLRVDTLTSRQTRGDNMGEDQEVPQ